MIEEVFWPSAEKWDPTTSPFFLELYGETAPRIDESYAEVVRASSDVSRNGANGGGPQPVADAPVYQYWWTLGHAGSPEEPADRAEMMEGKAKPSKDGPWCHLDDDVAARVYLGFPITKGWRAKEIIATLKYLSPIKEQHDVFEKVANVFKALQPALADSGSIAALVPGGATPSKWLETVSKLSISSLPTSGDKFKWSVSKMAFPLTKPDGSVIEGVVWELPKSVFNLLGGRITGSLAVSFLPSHLQSSSSPDETLHAEAGSFLMYAVLYEDDKPTWVPGNDPGYVELHISPVLAPAGKSTQQDLVGGHRKP